MQTPSGWLRSASGWCMWASLAALAGVIVVALASIFVASASEDAGEVMLNVLRVGFALVVATFLIGLALRAVCGWGGRG